MTAAISEASVFDVAQRRSWSFHGRAILIVVLLPLLAATWGLRSAMPPADLQARFDGRRPFVYWQREFDLTIHIRCFGLPKRTRGFFSNSDKLPEKDGLRVAA
jgi:hypothetical protein